MSLERRLTGMYILYDINKSTPFTHLKWAFKIVAWGDVWNKCTVLFWAGHSLGFDRNVSPPSNTQTGVDAIVTINDTFIYTHKPAMQWNGVKPNPGNILLCKSKWKKLKKMPRFDFWSKNMKETKWLLNSLKWPSLSLCERARGRVFDFVLSYSSKSPTLTIFAFLGWK